MKNPTTNLAAPAERTNLVAADGKATYDIALQVMERAQAGDETVIDDLRRLLNSSKPVCTAYMQTPLMAMIDGSTGANLLAREVAVQKVRTLKKELTGPSPTALEKMLVDRVVTCWFFLQDAEKRYASSMIQPDGMSFDLGDYHQRRITACQKRYNAAVVTLAKVRRLQLPDIVIGQAGQVNIADQQLNVAETTAATE